MSYFEICPNCNSDDVLFNRKKNFSRCEACGFTNASDVKKAEIKPEISHSAKVRIDSLPFPLALCFYEYVREMNPYLQLHRLTDAAELLTRFLTVIALSDILRLHGEFPDELKEELAKKIELPTFGAWKDLLRVAVACLEKSKQKYKCFVAGLPDYVNNLLLPLLGGNDGDPGKQIIPLRNLLAHQGRLSNKQATALLAHHQTQFEQLFHELNFLNGYDLIACVDETKLVYLHGLPQADGSFPAYARQINSIQFASESVYLLHRDQALNLFPLQVFGSVLHWRDDLTEPEEIVKAAPQIYFRFGRKGQLDFTPLTDEAFFAHQRGAALENFNQIFSLEEWRKTIAERKGIQISAFDDLLRELLAVFVGREADVKIAKQTLKESDGGVLWISGQPGVGKSALMAKLIDDYQNSSHHFVFPYLFRLGHTGCSVDGFLKAALARLYQDLNQPVKMGAHIEQRRTLFINLVREASQTLNQKIWFLIDGVDEIYRLDKSFLSLLFAASGERLVWLCAGRSEPPELEDSLRQQGADWVFPEGLGVLDEQGVRTMLLEHLDRLKFPLLGRDKQKTRQTANETNSTADQSDSEWSNDFIDTLTQRSEGLPLYVRMAIDDLQTGKLTVTDEKKLPEGLSAYFEQILERLRVSDVGTVLTPLFCLLVWAKEPVTEAALQELMSGHHLSKTSRWQESFQNALRHGHLMLRQELTPEGDSGWTFYHDSFRQHLQISSQIQDNREWAQSEWLNKCSQWQILEEKSLSFYTLRHLPFHLREAKQWDELFALARERKFRQAQIETIRYNPDLPLQTIQEALLGAANQDNVGAMAEFLLIHAKQVIGIMQESPLDALRAKQLERAWKLADLYDVELCLLWHLMLALQLKEACPHDAQKTLQRLQGRSFPKLDVVGGPQDWQCKMAVFLLIEVWGVAKEMSTEVSQKALSETGYRELCFQLAQREQIDEALKVVEEIRQVEFIKADALRKIVEELAQGKRINKALEVAERIGRTESKARALAAIAAGLARAKEKVQVKEVLEQSLKVAEGIDKLSGEKAETLREIAAVVSQMGQFDEAIKVAEKINVDRRKAEALAAIATELAQTGEKERAKEVLEYALKVAERDVTSAKGKALGEIAAGLAQAGELEQALRVAEEIKWAHVKLTVLVAIAHSLAKMGEQKQVKEVFDKALKIPEGKWWAGWKAEALREIAAGLAQSGEREWAKKILEQSLKVAETIEKNTIISPDKSYALVRIAKELERIGEQEWMKEVLEQALMVAERSDGFVETSHKAKTLATIAAVLERTGEKEPAKEIAERALKIVEGIKEGHDKYWVLCEIAKELAQGGQVDETMKVIAMIEWRMDEEGAVNKAQSLATIAARLARAGEREGAKKILEQALKVVAKTKRRAFGKASSLWQIAAGLTQTGEKEWAKQLLERALEVTESIEVPQDKAWALEHIAAELIQTGEKERAKEVLRQALNVTEQIWQPIINERLRGIAEKLAQVGQFDEALMVIQRIDWVSHKAEALATIAAELTQSGERERAERIFKQSLSVAKAIKQAKSKAEVLAAIGIRLAQSGETEQAKKIFEQSLRVAEEIEETRHKALVLIEIAKELARYGWKQETLKVIGEIPTQRRHLSEIAEALVEVGDRESFKHLLIPCAYFPKAAYEICGSLARLYPEQAETIANIVKGKTSNSDKTN